MLRRARVLMITVVSTGCAESLSTETWESTVETTRLVVLSERGTVEVDGREDRESVYVEASRYGRAAGSEKAEERLSGTSVDFEEAAGVATVTAASEFARAGVELEIDVPLVLDLDITADNSVLSVHDVEGTHRLDVNRLRSSVLRGAVSASVGGGGIDLELWPYDDATIILNTSGNLYLALPAYGPYELVIDAGLSTDVFIEDLGFDEVYSVGNQWVAQRFPATIQVQIRATGDRVEIVEAY